MKESILKDHANGMVLADIAKKYKISAEELVDIIIESGSEEITTAIFGVDFDTSDNTEIQDDDIVEVSIPLTPDCQESLPKKEYRPNPNDIFMDLIIFGMDLNSVCFKYNLPKGDVGIILEDIYKELSDRVIPMDDIKEAIKKICAEVYLARFN